LGPRFRIAIQEFLDVALGVVGVNEAQDFEHEERGCEVRN
jgi:hypothetical protein